MPPCSVNWTGKRERVITFDLIPANISAFNDARGDKSLVTSSNNFLDVPHQFWFSNMLCVIVGVSRGSFLKIMMPVALFIIERLKWSAPCSRTGRPRSSFAEPRRSAKLHYIDREFKALSWGCWKNMLSCWLSLHEREKKLNIYIDRDFKVEVCNLNENLSARHL